MDWKQFQRDSGNLKPPICAEEQNPGSPPQSPNSASKPARIENPTCLSWLGAGILDFRSPRSALSKCNFFEGENRKSVPSDFYNVFGLSKTRETRRDRTVCHGEQISRKSIQNRKSSFWPVWSAAVGALGRGSGILLLRWGFNFSARVNWRV